MQRIGLENAYLVPRAHSRWFIYHKLWTYAGYNFAGTSQEITDCIIDIPANGMALRADLLQVMDRGIFAFAVKAGSFCWHFLEEGEEHAQLFHDVRASIPAGIPAEMLYARFAWAVILNSKPVPSLQEVPLPIPVSPAIARKRARMSTSSHDPSTNTTSDAKKDGMLFR